MRTKLRTYGPLYALAVLAGVFAGCAQQVDTIDRTQPEALRKADFLESTWYIRQTVSDVPATSAWSFTGATHPVFGAEKIRWEIQESYLIAYRSYEHIPGANDGAVRTEDGEVLPADHAEQGFEPEEFKGEPIAAYAISGHFDIQRSYNSATGEETNVVVENTSDRNWYEQEWFRVDWSTNMIGNYTFINDLLNTSTADFHVGEDEPTEDARRMVYDDAGSLEYMDFVERKIVRPDLILCYYNFAGLDVGDCTGQEVEVRTSLLRVPAESEYEPVFYGDNMLSKFGFFRTERAAYDRRRGTTFTGRISLANRHNIWESTWQRDASGEIVRDESGKRVAMPFADRTPKPIVYHLSPRFPQEIIQFAHDTGAEWDRAFRRVVAAAKGMSPDDVRPMFIVCHNPVQEEAVYPAGYTGSECGEPGTDVRIGDLRYSVMWWVNNPQAAGPLGYGPSAADPETGEIISGTAYVYGAGVDRAAQRLTEYVQFINGDLEDEDLRNGDYVRSQVLARLNGAIDPRMRGVLENDALSRMDLDRDTIDYLGDGTRNRIRELRADLSDGELTSLRSDPGYSQRQFERIRESGMDLALINDEMIAGHGLDPASELSEEQLDRVRPASLNHNVIARHRQDIDQRLGHNCLYPEVRVDDTITGLAEHYAGRDDYNEIYQELRGRIFKGVMEHEIGHTVGLMHNFSGSWDSLNYHDEYWAAKREGYPRAEGGDVVVGDFSRPETPSDIYGIASLTPAQRTARMREFQYSSIMDYSSALNTDFGGLGKYDEAAVLFGYTTGADTSAQLPQESPDFNKQQWGYVEVWDNLPERAAGILSHPSGGVNFAAIGHPLERYHYSTVVDAIGGADMNAGVDRLLDRRIVKYGEVANGADGAVEVPYMFCEDNLAFTRQSCRRFDYGADPLEQTLHIIERYRTYHFFTNYRRDRLNFEPYNVLNGTFERYFMPIMDGFQRWFIEAEVRQLPDEVLDHSWTFGALSGLNLIGEVLQTPDYGSYRLETEDVFDPETGDRLEQMRILRQFSRAERADADFFLPEGPGRSQFSRYNGDLGYYYFNYPQSAGHFWTYIAAAQAFTVWTQVFVRGVDMQADFRSYIVTPYMAFQEEITRLTNAMFVGDYEAFAPLAVSEGGRMELKFRPVVTLQTEDGMIDPETGATVDDGLIITQEKSHDLAGLPVDLEFGFTQKLYPAFFGMAFFNADFSQRFQDQFQIFRLGSGEAIDPGPGYEVVEFCDPAAIGGGQCYAAIQPEDSTEPTGAVAMLEQANIYRHRWEAAVASGNTNDAQTLEFQLANTVELINILRSMYAEYGSNAR